ncbi:outer membrane lipoprotein chaperone LolA [Thiolapillus sp.]
MHKTRRLALLILLLFSGALMADVRQQLEHFLDDLHTLSARFSQELINTETDQINRSQGMFYLSRPDRFRWVYQGEYPRYIIADGKTVWLVEEDIEQVSQRSQKSTLEGTPASLFASELNLDRDFEIKDLGQRLGLGWLKLIPKKADSQFEQILLAFDGDRLVRMEMADRFGQVTRFEFFDLQRNLPLDESLFTFVPPPGYDILDQ